MNAEHTPTPWRLNPKCKESGEHVIEQESTAHIGHIALVWGSNNARLIVRAVNSHDELVKACELTIAYLLDPRNRSEVYLALESALAKAKGEQP